MAITVKSLDVFADLLGATYDPQLVKLSSWLAARNGVLVITSGYRPDGGIHSTVPCRAMDVRSHCYDDPQAVADDINAHWSYDISRPWLKCCFYHNSGRGLHFHLQVHPNTRYTEGQAHV